MAQVGTGYEFGAWEMPLLARFLGKLVLDILPAALASVIGGFLFTQYQFGHNPAAASAAQAAPASAEMMQLVRDEHAMILDFLKAQMAAEKSRHVVEDAEDARAVADARDAAEAKTMAEAKLAAEARLAAAASTRRVAAAVIAAKTPHAKSSAVAAAAPHAPLVIAQAEPAGGTSDGDTPKRDPDSLVGKTLDLKDHVVAATRRVVSAIGDIPSWIVARLGSGASATPERLVATPS